jgi:hypothetical protein
MTVLGRSVAHYRHSHCLAELLRSAAFVGMGLSVSALTPSHHPLQYLNIRARGNRLKCIPHPAHTTDHEPVVAWCSAGAEVMLVPGTLDLWDLSDSCCAGMKIIHYLH